MSPALRAAIREWSITHPTETVELASLLVLITVAAKGVRTEVSIYSDTVFKDACICKIRHHAWRILKALK